MLVGIWLSINIFIVPELEPLAIYCPVKKIEKYPSDMGMKYKDIYLYSENGARINGWFIKNSASKNILLILHGNGGNMSYSLSLIKILYGLPISILIIDYQAYGKSEGIPSEENLYSDAQTAYNYLVNNKKYKPEQVILMGTSLGGAVVSDLAVKNKVKALILQSTFTSAKDMAKKINPLYRWPLILIRTNFDNLRKVKDINIPLLVLHSKDDEVIPYEMSVSIYKNANQPKQIHLSKGYKHDDLVLSKNYIGIIREFMKKIDI